MSTRDAFLAIPRERFLGSFRTVGGEVRWYGPDTENYLATVHRDIPVIARADREGRVKRLLPAPCDIAAMLGSIGDLAPDANVLEVGTGCGYATALLSHQVPGGRVTTVESDVRLLRQARRALIDTGYAPTFVEGDGMRGHPAGAPYDVLIAWGVDRMPAAWLRQVRPGGVIVVGMGLSMIALRVSDDGSASGPLVPAVATRPSPAARTAAALREIRTLRNAAGRREPDLPLPDLTCDMPQLLRRLVASDTDLVADPQLGQPRATLYLLHRASGSWARIQPQGGAIASAEHDGQRDLLGEIYPLVSHWAQQGRPGPGRYGLTVTPEGEHHLWFSTPQGKSWPLPCPHRRHERAA